MSVIPLKQRWADFRSEHPKTRIRDAANQLQVSEAELVATGIGNTATCLNATFKPLLESLSELGEVMALTRNEAVVHEHHGRFGAPSFHGDTALFFRPEQDTRYFTRFWRHGFAVNESERLSLQFFDASGTAVHKIYMTDASDKDAYFTLVDRFRSDDQSGELVIEESAVTATGNTGISIDAEALQDRWMAIRDVHEGNRIIRDLGGHRPSIYRALGEQFARPLNTGSVEQMLNLLASENIKCMLFAMNHAAVQSYAGTLTRLLRTGPWFNVLDPKFNLHLRTDLIAQVWLITKHTDDGTVHTLSVIDGNDKEIMVLTDHRGRGQNESAQWGELLQKLD